MSDGPYKSLPMRPGWKKVAQLAENSVFRPEEVGAAVNAALIKDCRAEGISEFTATLHDVLGGQQQLLFPKQIGTQLEALRHRSTGFPLRCVLIDNVIQLAASSKVETEILVVALKRTIGDRASRCTRQVEEHYCRKSSGRDGHEIGDRIEKAVCMASISEIARHILLPRSGSQVRPGLKRKGLDDGVDL